MPTNAFSLGRDTQLVVIAPTGRIDLTHVTGFESHQMTQPIRVDRLDGTQMAAELPKGWEGSFDLERGSSAADDFIASTEQAFYTNGQLPTNTLYQYTDALGRTLTIHRLTALDRLRLFKAVPAHLAYNERLSRRGRAGLRRHRHRRHPAPPTHQRPADRGRHRTPRQ